MKMDINNISFSYGQKLVIDSVSLSFTPGLFYGIIGANGSGKTTLIDLLCGLIHPQKGVILLDGVPIRSISKRLIAQNISLVPQNFYINFPFTIHEIVMMGRHPHIGRFSRLSREDTDLIDHIMEITEILPLKNRKITELSGGERQRTLFARTLVQNTQMMVLDEATSNIDIRHALSLLNIVARKVQDEKKIAVSVFHDINLASLYCDILIFLESGRVKHHGTAYETINPSTIQSVFHVNATVYEDLNVNRKRIFFNR